nr:hypothetical protein [Streptomyces lasalocidi]
MMFVHGLLVNADLWRLAGMTCYKPGQWSRLIYAVREYRGRKDKPKGFGWRDFRDLIVRARIHSAARLPWSGTTSACT